MGDGQTDASTKEVIRYRDALWDGIEAIKKRPLGTNVFVSVCQSIKQTSEGVRTTTGTRIVTPSGKLIYTPPVGEDLLHRLLKNLEVFIHTEDGINPLIKMAIMHYQFEAIHPFSDGNGRTGRIANILYLLEKGYLETPVLFLSRYIIDNKTPYYLGLKNVTEKGAWEPWIIYMLEAVERTAEQTIKRIDAIKKAMDRFSETLKEEEQKIYSKDLVESAFTTPYFNIQSITRSLNISRQTAAKYLLRLEECGLIAKKRVGREVAYTNPSFIKALKKPL
jgi:Fic family protein